MTNGFALSAVLIALVAITNSAAFAESRTTRHDASGAFASVQAMLPAPQPMSGAEGFQNNGISEAMGYPYRRR
jgi:hypothetical protein